LIPVWLTLLLWLQAGAVPLDAGDRDGTAAARGTDTLLLEEVRRIGARVETLCGESFVRPPFAVRVPEEMRDVAAEIRAFAAAPRDRLAARGRAWRDLGLGDGTTPRRLMLVLASDLAGIGFDPGGNRLLVTPGRLRPEDFEPTRREDDPATVLMLTGMRPDEPVVGHLLMHVRQRERTGGDFLADTTDRLLAAAAWAEGEANLMAMAYLFSSMNVGRDVLEFVSGPDEVLDGTLLPPGLDRLSPVERSLVEFVHLVGFERAVERYRAGGWENVAEAAQGRTTTRDVMHPDRPPLPAARFAEPPRAPRPGMLPVDVDSLGEQAIVILLSSLTQKDSLGLLAADGWMGDRLVRWESGGASAEHGGITEWVTRWGATAGARSAGEAAADFDYAYGRALEARFPGRILAEVGEGSRTLITADRLYRIERRAPETGGVAEVRVLVRPLVPGEVTGNPAESGATPPERPVPAP